MVRLRDAVVFVDPVGNAIPAIVTAVWSQTCVNVAFTSLDERRMDTFGRQIERSTSVLHMSLQDAHGNYWRWTNELAKATERFETSA